MSLTDQLEQIGSFLGRPVFVDPEAPESTTFLVRNTEIGGVLYEGAYVAHSREAWADTQNFYEGD